MTITERLRRCARWRWIEYRDFVQAVWELLCAHCVLSAKTRVQAFENTGRQDKVSRLSEAQMQMIDRVEWAIVRAAVTVPWRADCLRQAQAARTWLLRHKIVTEVRFGSCQTFSGTPEMHAWLLYGDRVITGGNVSRFTSFKAVGEC